MTNQRLKEIEEQLQKIQFELQCAPFQSTTEKSRQDCAISSISTARSYISALLHNSK